MGTQFTGQMLVRFCFNVPEVLKFFKIERPDSLESFAGLGSIGSVQLDGSGYVELKAGDGLAAVALSDDTLLWMTVSGNGSYMSCSNNQDVVLLNNIALHVWLLFDTFDFLKN